jgi:hypothetical protein
VIVYLSETMIFATLETEFICLFLFEWLCDCRAEWRHSLLDLNKNKIEWLCGCISEWNYNHCRFRVAVHLPFFFSFSFFIFYFIFYLRGIWVALWLKSKTMTIAALEMLVFFLFYFYIDWCYSCIALLLHAMLACSTHLADSLAWSRKVSHR